MCKKYFYSSSKIDKLKIIFFHLYFIILPITYQGLASSEQEIFLNALQSNDLKVIRSLIASRSEVIYSIDTNCLHQTIEYGTEDAFYEILKSNPDSRFAVDDNDQTPLHIAARYRKTNMAEQIIGVGVITSFQDSNDQTPLHIAAHTRNLELFKMLIQSGTVLYLADKDLLTPLHILADCESTKVVLDLFNDRESCLKQKMPELENIDVNEALICSLKEEIILWAAIQENDTAVVKSLIQSSPKLINGILPQYMAALHIAVQCGMVEIVELLLDYGANVNAIDYQGTTPLLAAARCYFKDNQFIKVIDLLIRYGANVNVKNLNKNTLLHDAIERNNTKLLKSLFESERISVDVLDNQAKTPLQIAYEQYQRFYSASSSDVTSKQHKSNNLVHLLLWYSYQIVTHGDFTTKSDTVVELKNKVSQMSEGLNPSDECLKWIMDRIMNCNSIEQILEEILLFLKDDNEEKEDFVRKNMQYLLLKIDIFEKFNLKLQHIKDTKLHDAGEKLKNIFRYIHAKKMRKEIFNHFESSFLKNLLNLTTIQGNTQSTAIVNKIKNITIWYCNHAVIKSPFISSILEFSPSIKNQSIAHFLTQKIYFSKEMSILFSSYWDSHLKFIQNIKAHLDYVIENKGVYLNPPAQLFGVNGGKDILPF